jgi:hypothetical protein
MCLTGSVQGSGLLPSSEGDAEEHAIWMVGGQTHAANGRLEAFRPELFFLAQSHYVRGDRSRKDGLKTPRCAVGSDGADAPWDGAPR